MARCSTVVLGPDYMSRTDPVSRAASVCRDDFQPGITWGEPARLMADAMNHGRPRQTGASLILVRRRANEPGWPDKCDYMEKSQPG